MSMIKRWMEAQETKDVTVDALKSLVENEVIQHEVALGITRQIIANEGTDKLSPKQLAVFETHIEPLLTPTCEGDYCGGNKINIEDLPSAYEEQFEVGGLWCEECITAHYRIQDQMAKDD